MTGIMFGTDGWRGIMSKEFTSSNVKVVAQAIADYMKDHGLEGRGVVVMLGNGIATYITDRDAPAPVTARRSLF